MKIDYMFWLAMGLMIIGFVLPGVGVIGAQILMMR